MITRRKRFINRWLTWICLGIFLAAFWILFGEPESPTADPDYYGDRPVEEVCLGVLYFEADGVEESEAVEVSDRLRGYLRRTRRVHVPMKNEVDFAIREAGESADTRDIARILLADVLLTGTLSRSGRRYQLDARFIDSWNGQTLGQCEVEGSRLESLLNQAVEVVAETLAAALQGVRDESRRLE
jgi:TolB-like protein